MAPRTRILKIEALILWQFGLLAALDIPLFEMVTVYKMMELKRNLERGIFKKREDIFKLAEFSQFMAFLTASYCLSLHVSALKSMFSHSI